MRENAFLAVHSSKDEGSSCRDLHVFLFICCLISSGSLRFPAPRAFFRCASSEKGFPPCLFFNNGFDASPRNRLCAFSFSIAAILCRSFCSFTFPVSLLFTDSLWRMRYYTAGVHAFLFTASRTIITKLLSIVTNKEAPVFTSETTPKPRLCRLPS